MGLKQISFGLMTEANPFSGGRAVGRPPSQSARTTAARRDLSRDLICIFAGCIVYVIGLNALTAVHPAVFGGVTGIALLLHFIVPELDTGGWYFLLNLPLIGLGWRRLGRRFMVLTIIGIVFFSLAVLELKPGSLIVHDRIIATLLWGGICGLGAGLILRSRGSAGGFDILSIILSPKLGLSVATLGFAFNVVPLIAGFWLYDRDTILYSCLFFFIYSRVVGVVMKGITARSELPMVNDPFAGAADCESGEQTDATMEPLRFIPAENEASKHSIKSQTVTDLAA
jgi:uncharacterized membrane-anchored protein YitT (DUF2179 family)